MLTTKLLALAIVCISIVFLSTVTGDTTIHIVVHVVDYDNSSASGASSSSDNSTDDGDAGVVVDRFCRAPHETRYMIQGIDTPFCSTDKVCSPLPGYDKCPEAGIYSNLPYGSYCGVLQDGGIGCIAHSDYYEYGLSNGFCRTNNMKPIWVEGLPFPICYGDKVCGFDDGYTDCPGPREYLPFGSYCATNSDGMQKCKLISKDDYVENQHE